MDSILSWIAENPELVAAIVAGLLAFASRMCESADLKKYKGALRFLTDLHEREQSRGPGDSMLGLSVGEIERSTKRAVRDGKLPPEVYAAITESAWESDSKKPPISKAKKFWRKILLPVAKGFVRAKIQKEIDERM